jgi:AcrR family transcriptional regulator
METRQIHRSPTDPMEKEARMAAGSNAAASPRRRATAPPPHPEDSLFGEDEHASMRRLLLASLDTFADLGYHGTATRDIARRAQVSAGGLYSHYESKQALLERISRAAHEGMLARMREARAQGGTPTECLGRIVSTHVRFHAEYNTACRVANYELHSLTPENLKEMRKLRQGMEQVVSEVLLEGTTTGEFVVQDRALVTMFILSLGIDVSRWFRPGHRLTPMDLASQYQGLVLQAIKAPGAAGSRDAQTGKPSKLSKPRKTSLASGR